MLLLSHRFLLSSAIILLVTEIVGPRNLPRSGGHTPPAQLRTGRWRGSVVRGRRGEGWLPGEGMRQPRRRTEDRRTWRSPGQTERGEKRGGARGSREPLLPYSQRLKNIVPSFLTSEAKSESAKVHDFSEVGPDTRRRHSDLDQKSKQPDGSRSPQLLSSPPSPQHPRLSPSHNYISFTRSQPGNDMTPGQSQTLKGSHGQRKVASTSTHDQLADEGTNAVFSDATIKEHTGNSSTATDGGTFQHENVHDKLGKKSTLRSLNFNGKLFDRGMLKNKSLTDMGAWKYRYTNRTFADRSSLHYDNANRKLTENTGTAGIDEGTEKYEASDEDVHTVLFALFAFLREKELFPFHEDKTPVPTQQLKRRRQQKRITPLQSASALRKLDGVRFRRESDDDDDDDDDKEDEEEDDDDDGEEKKEEPETDSQKKAKAKKEEKKADKLLAQKLKEEVRMPPSMKEANAVLGMKGLQVAKEEKIEDKVEATEADQTNRLAMLMVDMMLNNDEEELQVDQNREDVLKSVGRSMAFVPSSVNPEKEEEQEFEHQELKKNVTKKEKKQRKDNDDDEDDEDDDDDDDDEDLSAVKVQTLDMTKSGLMPKTKKRRRRSLHAESGSGYVLKRRQVAKHPSFPSPALPQSGDDLADIFSRRYSHNDEHQTDTARPSEYDRRQLLWDPLVKLSEDPGDKSSGKTDISEARQYNARGLSQQGSVDLGHVEVFPSQEVLHEQAAVPLEKATVHLGLLSYYYPGSFKVRPANVHAWQEEVHLGRERILRSGRNLVRTREEEATRRAGQNKAHPTQTRSQPPRDDVIGPCLLQLLSRNTPRLHPLKRLRRRHTGLKTRALLEATAKKAKKLKSRLMAISLLLEQFQDRAEINHVRGNDSAQSKNNGHVAAKYNISAWGLSKPENSQFSPRNQRMKNDQNYPSSQTIRMSSVFGEGKEEQRERIAQFLTCAGIVPSFDAAANADGEMGDHKGGIPGGGYDRHDHKSLRQTQMKEKQHLKRLKDKKMKLLKAITVRRHLKYKKDKHRNKRKKLGRCHEEKTERQRLENNKERQRHQHKKSGQHHKNEKENGHIRVNTQKSFINTEALRMLTLILEREMLLATLINNRVNSRKTNPKRLLHSSINLDEIVQIIRGGRKAKPSQYQSKQPLFGQHLSRSEVTPEEVDNYVAKTNIATDRTETEEGIKTVQISEEIGKVKQSRGANSVKDVTQTPDRKQAESVQILAGIPTGMEASGVFEKDTLSTTAEIKTVKGSKGSQTAQLSEGKEGTKSVVETPGGIGAGALEALKGTEARTVQVSGRKGADTVTETYPSGNDRKPPGSRQVSHTRAAQIARLAGDKGSDGQREPHGRAPMTNIAHQENTNGYHHHTASKKHSLLDHQITTGHTNTKSSLHLKADGYRRNSSDVHNINDRRNLFLQEHSVENVSDEPDDHPLSWSAEGRQNTPTRPDAGPHRKVRRSVRVRPAKREAFNVHTEVQPKNNNTPQSQPSGRDQNDDHEDFYDEQRETDEEVEQLQSMLDDIQGQISTMESALNKMQLEFSQNLADSSDDFPNNERTIGERRENPTKERESSMSFLIEQPEQLRSVVRDKRTKKSSSLLSRLRGMRQKRDYDTKEKLAGVKAHDNDLLIKLKSMEQDIGREDAASVKSNTHNAPKEETDDEQKALEKELANVQKKQREIEEKQKEIERAQLRMEKNKASVEKISENVQGDIEKKAKNVEPSVQAEKEEINRKEETPQDKGEEIVEKKQIETPETEEQKNKGEKQITPVEKKEEKTEEVQVSKWKTNVTPDKKKKDKTEPEQGDKAKQLTKEEEAKPVKMPEDTNTEKEVEKKENGAESSKQEEKEKVKEDRKKEENKAAAASTKTEDGGDKKENEKKETIEIQMESQDNYEEDDDEDGDDYEQKEDTKKKKGAGNIRLKIQTENNNEGKKESKGKKDDGSKKEDKEKDGNKQETTETQIGAQGDDADEQKDDKKKDEDKKEDKKKKKGNVAGNIKLVIQKKKNGAKKDDVKNDAGKEEDEGTKTEDDKKEDDNDDQQTIEIQMGPQEDEDEDDQNDDEQKDDEKKEKEKKKDEKKEGGAGQMKIQIKKDGKKDKLKNDAEKNKDAETKTEDEKKTNDDEGEETINIQLGPQQDENDEQKNDENVKDENEEDKKKKKKGVGNIKLQINHKNKGDNKVNAKNDIKNKQDNGGTKTEDDKKEDDDDGQQTIEIQLGPQEDEDDEDEQKDDQKKEETKKEEKKKKGRRAAKIKMQSKKDNNRKKREGEKKKHFETKQDSEAKSTGAIRKKRKTENTDGDEEDAGDEEEDDDDDEYNKKNLEIQLNLAQTDSGDENEIDDEENTIDEIKGEGDKGKGEGKKGDEEKTDKETGAKDKAKSEGSTEQTTEDSTKTGVDSRTKIKHGNKEEKDDGKKGDEEKKTDLEIDAKETEKTEGSTEQTTESNTETDTGKKKNNGSEAGKEKKGDKKQKDDAEKKKKTEAEDVEKTDEDEEKKKGSKGNEKKGVGRKKKKGKGKKGGIGDITIHIKQDPGKKKKKGLKKQNKKGGKKGDNTQEGLGEKDNNSKEKKGTSEAEPQSNSVETRLSEIAISASDQTDEDTETDSDNIIDNGKEGEVSENTDEDKKKKRGKEKDEEKLRTSGKRKSKTKKERDRRRSTKKREMRSANSNIETESNTAEEEAGVNTAISPERGTDTETTEKTGADIENGSETETGTVETDTNNTVNTEETAKKKKKKKTRGKIRIHIRQKKKKKGNPAEMANEQSETGNVQQFGGNYTVSGPEMTNEQSETGNAQQFEGNYPVSGPEMTNEQSETGNAQQFGGNYPISGPPEDDNQSGDSSLSSPMGADDEESGNNNDDVRVHVRMGGNMEDDKKTKARGKKLGRKGFSGSGGKNLRSGGEDSGTGMSSKTNGLSGSQKDMGSGDIGSSDLDSGSSGMNSGVGDSASSGMNSGVGDSASSDISSGVGESASIDINSGVGESASSDINSGVGESASIDINSGVGESASSDINSGVRELRSSDKKSRGRDSGNSDGSSEKSDGGSNTSGNDDSKDSDTIIGINDTGDSNTSSESTQTKKDEVNNATNESETSAETKETDMGKSEGKTTTEKTKQKQKKTKKKNTNPLAKIKITQKKRPKKPKKEENDKKEEENNSTVGSKMDDDDMNTDVQDDMELNNAMDLVGDDDIESTAGMDLVNNMDMDIDSPPEDDDDDEIDSSLAESLNSAVDNMEDESLFEDVDK